MHAFRKSNSADKKCKKAMWKSIKKINPLSCFCCRKSSTTKCTMENALEDVTAIAAENNMLHETLKAEKTFGEVERTSTINSSKTEEIKNPEISDKKEQPQNVEIKDIKKKKNRRGKRKRNNVKSQTEIKEQIIEDEENETKSFDPSPICSIEETASVETVSNVFPSVVNNETEFPEIRECDNEIDDGKIIKIIQFQGTASAATMSDVSLEVDRVKNNDTDTSDNRYNVTAEQRCQTLNETLTAVKVDDDMERTSAVMNSSKTEEKISDTEGQPRNVEIEEIKQKKSRRGKRKHKNVKSQTVIKEQIIEDEENETKSFDPSPICSIEDTASVETVSNVFPSVVNNETEFPEIQECDDKIDDGKMIKIIQFQGTASAATMSDVSLEVDRVKNNETDTSVNHYNATAEQRCQTLNETLTAAKVDDDMERPAAKVDDDMVMNSSKTEEKISDTEGQPRNVEIEEIKKKKNKRENKKRLNHVKSQNAMKEQNIEGEGDVKNSFVPSPISSIKETATVETVNNILPSVIGDGDLHFQPETTLAKTIFDNSWRVKRINNNATERLDSRKSGNCYNGVAEQHSQSETTLAKTIFDNSWRVKRINNNATERLDSRKSGNCYNGVADQHSQSQPVIKTNSTGEGKSRKIVVHMCLSSNKNVVLNKTDNAWVPANVTRRAATDDDGDVAKTINETKTTEETNKSVRSILNKLTSENIDELIKRFMALPLNTIERLENAVDLVFERAIQEQSFAPLYAVLCSSMQSVQVTCAESMETKSFKWLMIKKCQRFFESDKDHQTESMKKLEEIRSCSDLEKQEELQFAYSENERKLRKRFVGNCCFIGELFNRHIIHPKIMLYCISNLICQRSENSIECLCNLLRTSGKGLERCCNLNDTFDNLKALTSVKNLPSRIRFMMQDIVELRRNKWLPRTGVGK